MATILIIEDNPQLRNMIQEMLGEEEHTVLTAQEGQEGLALFKAHNIDFSGHGHSHARQRRARNATGTTKQAPFCQNHRLFWRTE